MSEPAAVQQHLCFTARLSPTLTSFTVIFVPAMSNSIRQWRTKQNGLENLELVTAEMPTSLGEEEVLVEIKAVSLNYRDAEVIQGLYNHHKTSDTSMSVVPCADMCGVVVQVGSSSSKQPWKKGDRVLSIFNQSHLTGQITGEDMKSGLGLPLPGVLATHRVFPASGLIKAPENMNDEEASTLAIAATTAWMSINGTRPIGQPVDGKGQVVLLQGTGGVSMAGLQIAVASGATTIVTSSSDEKLQRAKKLGATHLINYKTNESWEEKVMELTNDRGADLILECGGAKTLRKSFDCIAFGGTIVAIGYLSGKEDEPSDRLNANVLALRRTVTLRGVINGPKDRFEEACEFYLKHDIHPVIDKVFPFEKANEALKYLWSGGHFGKVVVKV